MTEPDQTRADEAEVEVRPQRPPAGIVLRRFQGCIEAARELLEHVAPHAEELDVSRFSPAALAAVESLSPEKQKELREWFEQVVGDHDADDLGNEPSVPGAERQVSEEQSTVDGAPTLHTTPEGTSKSDAAAEALAGIFAGDIVAAVGVRMQIWRQMTSVHRGLFLYEALLTMAVASFEALLAGFATHSYLLFPGSLGQEEPEFSLRDLASFKSIEDAHDTAVASRVDRLMAGSLDDWRRWFMNNHKVDFGAFGDYECLVEHFQRRHLIVHTGGVVTRRYLANVSTAPAELSIGERLVTDRAYLDDALSRLYVFGTVVGSALWMKWVPNEANAAWSFYADSVYDLLKDERYDAVHELTRAAIDLDLPRDSSDANTLACNGWIARKHLEGVDAIAAEVKAWDTSALRQIFAIAKLALVDDHDELLRVIPVAVKSGELALVHLDAWPVFLEFRADDRYASFRASL